jgi:hypothetical protein
MPTILRRPLPVALALFALALALRLLFAWATPDAAGPFSPFYKGDAPLWLAYAAALLDGQPFALELGLPFRPPGTAWLCAALWDGTADGLAGLRLAWLLLGACLAPLTALAAWPVGAGVATFAGAVVATSSGAMMLAASPNSEVPYALIALASIACAGRLAVRPGGFGLLGFGVLHGLGCLVRAEHLLLALLLTVLVARSSAPGQGRAIADRLRSGGWRGMLLVGAGFLVVLAPWHLDAFAAVRAYNESPRSPIPAPTMEWTAAARAELEALPAFARTDTQRFVEATARHRGARRVGPDEFAAVDEAFGARPAPLPELFFVALYGPLNFRLANGPEAEGGFSRAALEVRPPLAGGAERYPPGWLASLPSGGSLSLDYPPHLGLVVAGYRLGMEAILADPRRALGLVGAKLWITWSGAAHGFGGHALPLGAAGLRRRVDLTVAEGAVATAWRIAGLLLLVLGCARARRCRAAWPWLAWLASALVVSAAFFGYARQGAMALPAVAVVWGIGLAPWCADPRRARIAFRLGIAAALLVLGVELVRFAFPPVLRVDSAPAGRVEPWPPLQFEERRVGYGSSAGG